MKLDKKFYYKGEIINFQTPPEVCKFMVSLIPQGAFTGLEPTPGQGNLSNAVKISGKYNLTEIRGDFYQTELTFYDFIIMNPPFTPMSKGYEILFQCMNYTNTVIALMPWLTLINSQARTQILRQYGLISVTHLPRNIFPGTRVQTCILKLTRGFSGKTELNFFPLQ